MQNAVQPGNVIELLAPYIRTSGQGALVGSIFGIACGDVASGVVGQFELVGVFDIAKTAVEVWAVGNRVYWDDSTKLCTTTAASNKLIGVALAITANPSSTGRVRLSAAFTI
jgi:predicted RecA/RadA family phage recombinase